MAGAKEPPKPATRPRRAVDPLPRMRKRHVALRQGLEAVIAFVDGPPRRAGATVCADALLLAVPKAERGPEVEAFLRAAGAKEPPARLQGMAEDAGVELATAIRALGAEIRAREGA